MEPTVVSEKTIVIYVGTRKLMAFEGEVGGGDPRILRSVELPPSEGFGNGLVTNLERAAASLQALWKKLSPSVSQEAASCWVVLENAKLKTHSFSTCEYYGGSSRTITSQEIRAVVDQTRSVATLPLTESVLQAVPESFTVNDTPAIRNPLGLEAQRLGVSLKLFTMNYQDFKNIARAFEAADLEVENYFPQTLTLSEAVLTEQEKDEGVIVVDIGEDSTELVLWKNRGLQSSTVLSFGGGLLAEKIAAEWNLDLHDAVKVRERYGAFELKESFGEELIPLIERNGKGNQQVRRRLFQEKFIEQAKSWLKKLFAEIDTFSLAGNSVRPHYVFTGAGVAADGFLEFLQKEFSRDARLGVARKIDAGAALLTDPSSAAALGMYRWLSENAKDYKRFLAPSGFFEKTVASAKNWFSNYF